MERHISLVKDLNALINMISVFRRERPAMVHSMTPKAGLLSKDADALFDAMLRMIRDKESGERMAPDASSVNDAFRKIMREAFVDAVKRVRKDVTDRGIIAPQSKADGRNL